MHLDPCAQSDGQHAVTAGIPGPHRPRPGSTTTLHHSTWSTPESGAFPSIPRDPHASKTPFIMTDHPSSSSPARAREGGEGDTGRAIAEGNKRYGPHRAAGVGPPACGTPRTWSGAPPEGTPAWQPGSVHAMPCVHGGGHEPPACPRTRPPRPRTGASWQGSGSHAASLPSLAWLARAAGVRAPAQPRRDPAAGRPLPVCPRQRRPRSSLPHSHYHALEGSTVG